MFVLNSFGTYPDFGFSLIPVTTWTNGPGQVVLLNGVKLAHLFLSPTPSSLQDSVTFFKVIFFKFTFFQKHLEQILKLTQPFHFPGQWFLK